MSEWYTDSDGSISQCAKHMESAATQLEWRKEYWKVFEESLLIKTKDWEKEDEYRIVLADIGGILREKENRNLKYKFEDLDAIIFGSRTPLGDKLKIMKIIETKCRSARRSDFKFYQADYSSSTSEMQLTELTSLKFDIQ